MHGILDQVVIHSRDYYYSRLGSPWSIGAPSCHYATFHILQHGSGYCRLAGQPQPQRMNQGDLILLPHGHQHTMFDLDDSNPEPLEHYLRRTQPESGYIIRHNRGTNPVASMICGVFEVEGFAFHPLLRCLPPLIHWPAFEGKPEGWLSVLLSQIQEEVEQRRPGHHSILSKIFDIIFCQTLRKWVAANATHHQDWTSALQDSLLRPILESIHRQPGAPWTVERLAREASMSRSQFASKFCQRVGVSPMVYVTRWRLWRSYQLLRQRSLSVSEIAEATGFSCETALARAFRREFGISPTEVRKVSEQRSTRSQVS